MNEKTNIVSFDAAAQRFSSLASLRAAHSDLLKRNRESGNLANLLNEVEHFIQRGRATGALLTDDDRWDGQSILDYWATALYRAGREVEESILEEFDPTLAPEIPDEECPYLGLDAFREANTGLFFGRLRLVQELVERLKEVRLLALVGPSGSGKSSLVLAGLLPALKEGALPGSADWRFFPPMTPGSDPLASLARLVEPAAANPAELVQDRIESFKRQPDYLTRMCAEPAQRPAVLVIDQFEEIFTLCDDEPARQAFIANLLHFVRASTPRHSVILTMRSDYESYVEKLQPDFVEMFFEQAHMRMTPLSASELREAIERPAERVGLKFEAGMVDALIQDILGEPAGLPLLQFTLLKLWDSREQNRVTWESYRRLGGGRLALARSADAFYNGLIEEEQRAAKRILLRMVRPATGLEVTSSRVRRETLYRIGNSELIDRVLGKLIKARLVRLAEGETPADDQVEVAHEALVRNWPRLVDWLEELRSEMITRRRLEAKAAEWTRLGKGASGLLDEVQLHEAEQWLESADAAYLGYAESLPELVRASRAALEAAERGIEETRQRELEQMRKLAETERQRAEAEWQRAEEQQQLIKVKAKSAVRMRIFALALAVMFILALLAATFARMQRGVAQENYRQAQANLKMAEVNYQKAIEEQEKAKGQAEIARKRETEAQTAKQEAEDSLKKAKEEGLRANQQARLAAENAAEANRQWMAAEKAREEMEATLKLEKLNIAALSRAQSGDNQGAITRYTELLESYRRAGDAVGEASALTSIGAAYASLSRYDDAVSSYRRALEIREKALGPEHPDVATILDRLAGIYRNQNRRDEAEPFYQRALAIREKALGKEHTEVAISLDNLAALYREQGQHAKAERLYLRALAIREKAWGTESQSLINTVNNLAAFYREWGKYDEAEKYYKQALTIFEKTWGPESINVANYHNTLAGFYRGQGKYAEAEDAYQRALEIRKKVSGAESPNVISGLGSLADFYREQGKYAEAEKLYQQVVTIYQKSAPGSAALATGLSNLGRLYRDWGNYPEAEKHYQQALEIRKKASGEKNASVALSLSDLATLYRTQGRYDEAEPRYKEALAILEKIPTTRNTSLAAVLGELATLYHKQGKYADAAPYYQRARIIYEQALGPNHPTVAASISNLATLYRDWENYAEAEKLYQQAVTIYERAGPKHPSLATVLEDYAELLRRTNREVEADRMEARAREIPGRPIRR